MKTISNEEFLELEKEIKERFSEGDICIGFTDNGRRGSMKYILEFPLKLSKEKTSILSNNDYRVYHINSQDFDKFALNLSRGETLADKNKNKTYSII